MNKGEVEAAIAAIGGPLRAIDSWVLIFGALVAISLAVEVIFSIVHWIKEREIRLASQLHEAEMADLLTDMERSRASIAEANALAEWARQQAAAQANLALERFKAPRSLSVEQQHRIARKLKQFSGTTFDAGIGPKGDPEPLQLIRDISAALALVGWKFIPWSGAGETYEEPPMPQIGLTTVTNVIADVHPERWTKFAAAATALAEALTGEGIAAVSCSRTTTMNTDAIHIRIGPKSLIATGGAR